MSHALLGLEYWHWSLSFSRPDSSYHHRNSILIHDDTVTGIGIWRFGGLYCRFVRRWCDGGGFHGGGDHRCRSDANRWQVGMKSHIEGSLNYPHLPGPIFDQSRSLDVWILIHRPTYFQNLHCYGSIGKLLMTIHTPLLWTMFRRLSPAYRDQRITILHPLDQHTILQRQRSHIHDYDYCCL